MPMISIITVVRDDLEGLRITAASISRQNTNDFEWVIVDGFSGDGTYEFAQSLLSDSQIVLIQAPALGIYNAMNLGIGKARGDWVWHLNAGDVLLKDSIVQEMLEIASEQYGLSVIATSVLYLSHLGYTFSVASPEIISKSFPHQAYLHHQGAIFSRKNALAYGGYDEKLAFAADGELLDKLIRNGKYAIYPIATVGFEMGGASSLNYRKTLEEISSYRDYSLRAGPKLRLLFKNKLRGVVLRFEKSNMLQRLVRPYLVIRQLRIHNQASDLSLEPLKLLKSRPYFIQKPFYNGKTNIKMITFADGTYGFRSAGRRLVRQADKSSWFNSASSHWTVKKIQSLIPDFAEQNMNFIKGTKKGLGLWIWKAAVLDFELGNSLEGDILVMLDSGCQLNVNPQSTTRFNQYINLCGVNSILLMQLRDGAFGFSDLSDSAWTKTETLDFLDPKSIYRFSNQIQSGVIIIKNNSAMRSLIKEWVELCQLNDRCLLVDPDEDAAQSSNFVQHRWEQSILSLLIKSKNLNAISDETYFYPDWKTGIKYPIWAMRNRSGGDAYRRNLVDLMRLGMAKFERTLRHIVGRHFTKRRSALP